MLGSATLTIEASRTTTNCAMQSKINAVHRRSRYSLVVLTCFPFVVAGAFWLHLNDERSASNGTVAGMLVSESGFRFRIIYGNPIPFATPSSPKGARMRSNIE